MRGVSVGGEKIQGCVNFVLLDGKVMDREITMTNETKKGILRE